MIIENKILKSLEIVKDLKRNIQQIPHEEKLIFISPEKTKRLNIEVDYRSDYYSLGVILFHLFSKQYPFSNTDTMQLIYAHIAVTPPSLLSIDPTIPPMIDQIVQKLLNKNPYDRYQSKEGILYDLEYILQNPNKTFILASNDFIKTFQIPQKLYGREKQIEQISSLVNAKEKSFITISGHSGIGKSALVNQIHNKQVSNNIFFAEAKFEQQKNMQSFNAIFELLSSYIKMILLKEDAIIENFQEKLITQIGNNIQLIADVIPELKAIIPQKLDMGKLHPNETQNRFNITFLKFIETISSFDKKIVLFIDDMQWSDVATIKMLELILNDANITNISVILAYRNNEIKSSHPFLLILKEFERYQNHLSVELSSLEQQDIELLITETFLCKKTEAKELAQLLKQKTEGNPFFIKELLDNLVDEQIVSFDNKTRKWSWDTSKLQKLKISDNVVDIVTKKIEQSSLSLKEILKYAALFGTEFDLTDIATILKKEYTQVKKILDFNQSFNFVIKSGKNNYRFVHDKVQEAFGSYLSKKEKKQFHYEVGIYLLDHSKDFFKTANHLNSVKDLVVTTKFKNTLIALNYKCAKNSLKSNSYLNAIYYLEEAISLQESDKWQNDYERSRDIHTLLTQAYYLNLDFKNAKNCFTKTLQHVKNLSDKIKISQIEIFSLIAQNKMNEALSLGLSILEEFGIKIPQTDDMGIYYPKLFELYDLNNIAALENLPKMEDETKLNIIEILNSIMAPAYLVAPHIYPKICYVAIDHCITYGNSAASTNVYAVHALLLSAFFNEFE